MADKIQEKIEFNLDELRKALSYIEKFSQAQKDSGLVKAVQSLQTYWRQTSNQILSAQVSVKEFHQSLRALATGPDLTTKIVGAQFSGEIKKATAQVRDLASAKIAAEKRARDEIIRASKYEEEQALVRKRKPAQDQETLLRQRLALENQLRVVEATGRPQQVALYANRLKGVNAEISRRVTEEKKIIQAEKEASKIEKERLATAKKTAAEVQRQASQLSPEQRAAKRFSVQTEILSNWLVLSQLFNLMNFGRNYVVELDKAFRDLQAIAAATDTEMSSLSKSIEDASRGTRFSAVEVAQAAKTLAQAGLSAREIQVSIKDVVLLATATGSDLASATDVMTSALSIFNLQAKDTEHVANVLTSSLNLTKLTIDKVAAGLQYAGNTSAEAGLDFEETVAVLGAMSQAGIRTGSTLGTGLRQVLTSFLSPTAKLQKELNKVGLGLDDVDIKAKGFTGVLRTLRDSGFDAASGFESLGTRGAAAFAAIQRNPDVIEKLEQAFLYSTAAAAANEVQMRSLDSQYQRFKNTLGLTLKEGFEPLKNALTDILGLFGKGEGSGNSALTKGLGILTTGLLGSVALTHLGKLVGGLTGLGGAFAGVAAASGMAAKGTALFGSVIGVLASPFAKVTYILSAMLGVYTLLQGRTATLTSQMDKSKAAMDTAQAGYEETKGAIVSLDENLGRLTDRYAELRKHPEQVNTEMIRLKNQFPQLTVAMNNGRPAIDNLIDGLSKLRQELRETSLTAIDDAIQKRSRVLQQQAEMAAMASRPVMQTNDLFRTRFQEDLTKFREVYPSAAANRGQTVLSQGSKLFGMFQGLDPKDRNLNIAKFQTEIDAQIGRYNTAKYELEQVIKGLEKSENSLDKALLKKYKGIYEALDAAKGRAAEYAGNTTMVAMLKTQRVDDAFSTTKFYRDFEEKMREKTQELSVLSQRSADAKDSKEQLEIQQEYNRVKQEYVKSVTSSALAEVEGLAAEILAKTGFPVVPEDLTRWTAQRDAAVKAFEKGADDQLSKNVASSVQSVSKMYSEANKALEKTKNALDKAGRGFDIESKKYDYLKQESAQGGGLYGRYNDADLYAFDQRQKELSIQAMKAKLGAYPGLEGAYGKLISEKQQAAAHQRTLTDPDSKLKGVELDLEVIKLQQDLVSVQQERLDLQNRLDASTGNITVKQLGFTGSVLATVKAERERLEVESQWGANIRGNLTGAIKEATSSMADFFYAIETGSESAGTSFRSFTTGILKNMLNVLNNQIASSFMSTILGGVTRLIAPSISQSDITWNTPAPSMRRGGPIRAAQGYGVAGRDSVHLLGMPGEYLLNTGAVSMIGKENLDRINSQSNSRVSKGSSPVVLPQKSSPTTLNVYVVSPEAQPSLGPNDVIAVISRDLATGGPVKKLVKSIQTGG